MKTIFAFALSFIIGMMPLQLRANQQVVFQEDFTDNRHNWAVVEDDSVSLNIKNGTYMIENKVPKTPRRAWQNNTDANFHGNFQMFCKRTCSYYHSNMKVFFMEHCQQIKFYVRIF